MAVNDRIMAGQNHELQRSRTRPAPAIRCERLSVHRQIQHIILSRHDSVASSLQQMILSVQVLGRWLAPVRRLLWGCAPYVQLPIVNPIIHLERNYDASRTLVQRQEIQQNDASDSSASWLLR